MKSPREKRKKKARSLVGIATAAVYRRLKSIQLQGEVFVSEIIARKWKVNATWRLSRQGASERADAMAACSFSAQAIEESLGIGSALCNGAATWVLRSLRPGGEGAQGLAPQGPGTRGWKHRIALAQNTGHEEAQHNRNTGEAARRASGKAATQTLGLSAIYLDRILGIVAFCVAM